MAHDIRHISERLAHHAEAVCAHYLSNGMKSGRYWLVGDVFNTRGRSLWVRLVGPTSGPGAAGNWTDEATGEYGDLVDLIRINRQLNHWSDVREEALTFLSEPRRVAYPMRAPAPRNSPEAARRLFAGSRPVKGSLAETYLASRGIIGLGDIPSLRFHPSCFYRARDGAALMRLPALVAAITSLTGDVTAVLRTYLAEDGRAKASVSTPRLVLGDQLGHAIRIGPAGDALLVGEGLETVLTLRSLLPSMPMNAAGSGNHLAALRLPKDLKRLYIAVDNDSPGRTAAQSLIFRAMDDVVHIRLLIPRHDDWNTDLQLDGREATFARLADQLSEVDRPPRAR